MSYCIAMLPHSLISKGSLRVKENKDYDIEISIYLPDFIDNIADISFNWNLVFRQRKTIDMLQDRFVFIEIIIVRDQTHRFLNEKRIVLVYFNMS